MKHFITVRQRHIIDPAYGTTTQASTILITSVPPWCLHVSALKRLFAPMPGGVKNVWINHDVKDLPNLYNERLAALNALKSAEISLLSAVAAFERKRQKAIAKGKEPKVIDPAQGRVQPYSPDGTVSSDPERPPTLVEQLVPLKKHPTHRVKPGFLPFGLPFVGQKADTIERAKEEVPRIHRELAEKQAECMVEITSRTRRVVRRSHTHASTRRLYNSTRNSGHRWPPRV
jgi:hypothetical protein